MDYNDIEGEVSMDVNDDKCLNIKFDESISDKIRKITQIAGRDNSGQTVMDALKLFAFFACQVGKGYVKNTKDAGFKFKLLCLKNESEWQEVTFEP